MDYQKTVNHVMSFLKEKGVCSSSRKSHQECYAALGEYLQTTGEQYNETVRDAWFSVMKTRYSSNKCVFWEQYRLLWIDTSVNVEIGIRLGRRILRK